MSIDYLEELEQAVSNGRTRFAVAGPTGHEWVISDKVEDLRTMAQRTADARKFPTHIYRMVNKMETVTGDSYLVVRKIMDPGPRGEPHMQWAVVDTREAAEMLRDVSQGPSPFFGAVVEESFTPRG